MSEASPVYLSVIVPAFNEETRLPPVLRSIAAYLESQSYAAEILVVDDGSSDATAEVARAAAGGAIPVQLVQHPDGRNHGKGAAVRLGMLEAQGRVRLFMDSDNSTTVDQVQGLLALIEGGADVAIGSRRTVGANIARPQGLHRDLAGRLGNLFIRVVAIGGFADTQAGVENADAIAQPSQETLDRLRGERDLGHQDQGRPAGTEDMVDSPKVDLRLAGTGHAVNQEGGVPARFQAGPDTIPGGLLVGGQGRRRGRRGNELGQRIAYNLGCGEGHQAALL